jgi:hypothetical protein
MLDVQGESGMEGFVCEAETLCVRLNLVPFIN